MAYKPAWQKGRFAEEHNDPLTGFANIMDVMLVFAVGLMLALVSQSETLKAHFNIQDEYGMPVVEGKELNEVPRSIEQDLEGAKGTMKSLGQVYQDPETGKLILIKSGEE